MAKKDAQLVNKQRSREMQYRKTLRVWYEKYIIYFLLYRKISKCISGIFSIQEKESESLKVRKAKLKIYKILWGERHSSIRQMKNEIAKDSTEDDNLDIVHNNKEKFNITCAI